MFRAQQGTQAPINAGSKIADLEQVKVEQGTVNTTNTGTIIDDDENSLKVGARGPTLLEDFHFREKIMHFDHERIPERVVHARGEGAHGYFQPYESAADITKARLFQDPSIQTPLFVRFSTVLGSRGSTDLARDVRGFAIKFYTEDGIWDMVGNNIPVFFIQDAINFPDIIHAGKPEQDREIPQAATAHDTFWDFVSLKPETAHMLMWTMSDRAIPRSMATMEGFGVNTYRFVNEKGRSHFVKFHIKPAKGVQSVVWDEAVKISGADPDFHRNDLYEAIARGDFPEYEFGVQLVPEEDENKFDFDILDATKIIPEELVPIRPLGKIVLNRNPDNFFCEVEQVAFCVQHVVPGIDFSNDPLLQGRLFSYLDTQLLRVGPNFQELPINRPLCPVRNNQRDGFARHTAYKGRAAYTPSSIAGGCPFIKATLEGQDPKTRNIFRSYPQHIDGEVLRARGEKFADHYSQATMFWNSMSKWEKRHIIDAFSFELNCCESEIVRQRVLDVILANVHPDLARGVAEKTGLKYNPSGGDCKGLEKNGDRNSPAVSMDKPVSTIRGKQIAILATGDGAIGAQIDAARAYLEKKEGAVITVIARNRGVIKSNEGDFIQVDASEVTSPSVLFDALIVIGGDPEKLKRSRKQYEFVNDAFYHYKPILAFGSGVELLRRLRLPGPIDLVDVDNKKREVKNTLGVISAHDDADVEAALQALVLAMKRPRAFERGDYFDQ